MINEFIAFRCGKEYFWKKNNDCNGVNSNAKVIKYNKCIFREKKNVLFKLMNETI